MLTVNQLTFVTRNPDRLTKTIDLKPKFAFGRLLSTPGAIDALECAGQTPLDFITRDRYTNPRRAGPRQARPIHRAAKGPARPAGAGTSPCLPQ